MDGKYTPPTGPVVTNTSTTYTAASVAADISAKVVSAATDLGTANTKTVVTNDPSVAGTVVTDVTAVVAPSPAVLLAKALFAELRTTLHSFSNSSKTGFLDLQAVRASDDMKLVVAPEADKLFSRLSTIGLAIRTFEGAQVGAAFNGGYSGSVGLPDLATPSAWINRLGSVYDVVNGTGGLQFCFAALTNPSTSTVTCLSAVAGAVNASGKIKFVKYVLTSTGNGQFSYTAVRENRSYDPTTYSLTGVGSTPTTTLGAAIPSGSGTVSKTGSTSFTFAGTLPPSATYAFGTLNSNSVDISGNPSTGVDTVALSATKTALSATSSSYALSGSVATTSLDTGKTVSIALNSGSHLDIDETNAATTGNQLLALNVVGTAQTAGTKLTGSITVSGVTKDKSGTQTTPSSIVFNGAISDVSANGAGEILTGKLETAITGYSAFDATKLTSSSNYYLGTVSFTGTVQAPARPQLKLVLSATKTAFDTGTATVDYSYGTVRITGSATNNSTTSVSTSLISNQDGIQIAPNTAVGAKPGENLITKAGVTLGTYLNGLINYADGTSESFN